MPKNESTWALERVPHFPALTENMESEVVVIGGGLAGLFNAYLLAKAGWQVILLEKEGKILQQTTELTTAFITQEIDTDFRDLVKRFGRRKANLVWESGKDAINLIASVIRKEKIDCDYKPVSLYWYANTKSQFRDLEKEFKEIKKSGFKVRLSDDPRQLNFPNYGHLELPDQAMFHPLKFAKRLTNAAAKAGVKIFTKSEVLGIGARGIRTAQAEVRAKHIVVTTYDPITDKGTHFKKGMYVSYVFEAEIPTGLIPEGIYEDANNPYHYFRVDRFPKRDRMIIGGEDNRKEIRVAKGKNFRALQQYLQQLMAGRQYKITRRWTGPILEPSDGLALIGKIRRNTYVACAFSGNGMTYSAISALIMKDLISRHNNPYIKLYDPRRIPSVKQLAGKAYDYGQEFFGGVVKNALK